MQTLAEMRAELREIRKATNQGAVSRMKKADISLELSRLRNMRETTPPAAATPSAPPKMMKSEVENIKDVKKSVLGKVPAKTVKDKMVKPSEEKPKADMKAKPAAAPKSGKKLTKAELLKMVENMSGHE